MNDQINCAVIKPILNVKGIVIVNLQYLDKCVLHANSWLDFVQLKNENVFQVIRF